jgi:hypothetical protein
MPKQWERYNDNISTHYLCALINGDYTGMPQYEIDAFEKWRTDMEQTAIDDGWKIGHWTTEYSNGDNDFYYGTCSVSNLRANVETVYLMVYKDMKTLRDVLPNEFVQYFCDIPAFKYRDVEVVREFGCGGEPKPWPGPHKNVHYWVLLANGKAVGWNENPATGWSFPVIGQSTIANVL